MARYLWMWFLFSPLALACKGPEDMRPLGAGVFSLWGFEVYRAATFRCPDTRLHAGRHIDGPLLLQLTYSRAIGKQRLLDATETQWQRLGVSAQQRRKWLRELDGFWPSVNAGDQLSLFVDRLGVSHFLLGHQPLGRVTDTAFGPDFVAIWLHPDSAYPQLRSALLGDK